MEAVGVGLSETRRSATLGNANGIWFPYYVRISIEIMDLSMYLVLVYTDRLDG